MTPKQQRFVEEYLIDLNATAAAKRAGYSKHTAKQIGTENLAKPVLQEAIQEAREEISRRNEISQDWLIGEFKENHSLAREGNPVVDRYGKPTGSVMRQINASNKALESIAVITGHWVNKHKHGGDPDNPVELRVITGVPDKE